MSLQQSLNGSRSRSGSFQPLMRPSITQHHLHTKYHHSNTTTANNNSSNNNHNNNNNNNNTNNNNNNNNNTAMNSAASAAAAASSSNSRRSSRSRSISQLAQQEITNQHAQRRDHYNRPMMTSLDLSKLSHIPDPKQVHNNNITNNNNSITNNNSINNNNNTANTTTTTNNNNNSNNNTINNTTMNINNDNQENIYSSTNRYSGKSDMLVTGRAPLRFSQNTTTNNNNNNNNNSSSSNNNNNNNNNTEDGVIVNRPLSQLPLHDRRTASSDTHDSDVSGSEFNSIRTSLFYTAKKKYVDGVLVDSPSTTMKASKETEGLGEIRGVSNPSSRSIKRHLYQYNNDDDNVQSSIKTDTDTEKMSKNILNENNNISTPFQQKVTVKKMSYSIASQPLKPEF
jgi:hypothetical protein